MMDTAERTEPQLRDAQVGATRHPSGWWKASDGDWYPPQRDEESKDLTRAMSIAVGAVVVGSFLPWAHLLMTNARGTDGIGNLTLLFGGIAGAFLARWRLEGGARRGFMTASLVFCAAAAGVLLYEVVHVTRVSAQPQSGLFLATAGAIIATALAAVLRHSVQSLPLDRT